MGGDTGPPAGREAPMSGRAATPNRGDSIQTKLALRSCMARDRTAPLRRGWTTGACAAAAARAAFAGLLTGRFPDPVTIRLPRGQAPSFPLALAELGEGFA